MPGGQAVRTFISYSHDSPEHELRVRGLAERLMKRGGVDCVLDLWVRPGGPPEGWPKWMDREVSAADVVLVVCTDLHRRAEVSQRANDTYLDALGAVSDDTPASQVFDEVACHTSWRGRRVRALRIGDPADIAVLQAISRGEFATSGFRNADVRDLLYPKKRIAPVEEIKKLSARTGRLLRLLRAHGLIRKVQRSHRYRLTPRGQLLTAALFAARNATLKQLIAKAA